MVKRGGEMKPITLALPDGWRSKSDISKRVGTWGMRGMALGGMVLEDLSDEERAARGLKNADLTLVVKSVGQYGKHAAAKKAGFQKDDVILQIGHHLYRRITEGELLGFLLQTYRVGEELPVTVLRGKQRVELKLPMQ